jgi:decaprenyl-phosphate phosphoribosyltransferase
MAALPEIKPKSAAAPTAPRVAWAIVKAARPRQWVKNLFVAAPLVFSKQLGDSHPFLIALLAVAIFCAVSSGVYLWNDLVDIEKDRAHPRKRHRPIPSGELPVPAARAAAATLAAGGLAAAFAIDRWFAVCVGAYLLLNFAYSLWLKKVVYLDVLCIALGFILRVLGGGFAISVEVTNYLVLCTFLLALFLGFGKRAHELASTSDHTQRPVLRGYSAPVLRWGLLVLGALTFASYVAYTRAPHTVSFFGTSRMLWTAPFALVGLWRFWWLVHRNPSGDSPTEEILHDLPFMANLLLYGGAVVMIIYFK